MELTEKQKAVIEALRKHRCDILAACTEEHWRKGETYYIDSRVNVPQLLRRKFEAAQSHLRT